MSARTDDRWDRLLRLLEPVHDRALATARRLCRSAADGDDLYQEAVVRAFEKLHTLRDETRFGAWFYATLLSRHRTRTRRTLWRRFLPWQDAFPDGHGPAGEDGRRWEEKARRAARIGDALQTLSAEQREAVVMFEVDGYPIEEIAAMQGVSLSAVKSRLARGREKLKRHYERMGYVAAPGPGRGPAVRLNTAPAEAGKEQSDVG
jgi:RNA polymerase sigma-70 factor, ECF subfamily